MIFCLSELPFGAWRLLTRILAWQTWMLVIESSLSHATGSFSAMALSPSVCPIFAVLSSVSN